MFKSAVCTPSSVRSSKAAFLRSCSACTICASASGSREGLHRDAHCEARRRRNSSGELLSPFILGPIYIKKVSVSFRHEFEKGSSSSMDLSKDKLSSCKTNMRTKPRGICSMCGAYSGLYLFKYIYVYVIGGDMLLQGKCLGHHFILQPSNVKISKDTPFLKALHHAIIPWHVAQLAFLQQNTQSLFDIPPQP